MPTRSHTTGLERGTFRNVKNRAALHQGVRGQCVSHIHFVRIHLPVLNIEESPNKDQNTYELARAVLGSPLLLGYVN